MNRYNICDKYQGGCNMTTLETRLVILYIYLAVMSVLHAIMLRKQANKLYIVKVNIATAILWSLCAICCLIESICK